MPETEKVRLGALVVNDEANHRKHRRQHRIDEYVRMLQNGELPPPIKVHRKTNTILNGLHRFFALKAYAKSIGKDWQDARIDVVWVDDVPDPTTEPELFAAQSAVENRHNGEPLDPADVIRVIANIIEKHGKEEARKWALKMNHTNASFEEIYRLLNPPKSVTAAVLPARTPEPKPTPPAEASGNQPTPSPPPVKTSPAATEPPHMRAVQPSPPVQTSLPSKLGPVQIHSMRTTRPPILTYCKLLREAIKEALGDFTEGERTEMAHTYAVLAKALDK